MTTREVPAGHRAARGVLAVALLGAFAAGGVAAGRVAPLTIDAGKQVVTAVRDLLPWP